MQSSLHSSLDLTQRRNEAEWLDGTDIDPVELENVLRDLASFNGAFLGHYPLIHWLGRAVSAAPKGTPLTVVDVGCGTAICCAPSGAGQGGGAWNSTCSGSTSTRRRSGSRAGQPMRPRRSSSA